MEDTKTGAGTMTRSKGTNTCNFWKSGYGNSSNIAAHLSSEIRTRERRPVVDKAAKKCAKTTEGELDAPKRYESSRSCGLALASAVTSDKLREINQEESQDKEVPKYKQCIFKNSGGDKRRNKILTKSYTASLQLQVEHKEKETRELDGRNKSKNPKEETKMSGVKKDAREKEQIKKGLI